MTSRWIHLTGILLAALCATGVWAQEDVPCADPTLEAAIRDALKGMPRALIKTDAFVNVRPALPKHLGRPCRDSFV